VALLSPSGEQLVSRLSQRYGVSTDAAKHMLMAVYQGGGSMAQFNHHEFGGAGQWMRGGMTMVGDMFNTNAKMLVERVCEDIATELGNHQTGTFVGSFQSQSQSGSDQQSQSAGMGPSENSLFVPDPRTNWWPKELGAPNATGSQNSTRYAYFAQNHRLAIATGSSVWVYDTLDHQIGGFSQQQSGDGSITLTSQYGTVRLSTLPVVMRDGAEVRETPPPGQPQPTPPPRQVQEPTASDDHSGGNASSADPTSDSIFATIERLGGLLEKGLITQDEFDAKKADLLERL